MGESDGYFPRGSMLRTVQEERVVGLFYGQRALCVGTLMPLNFIGTIEHTRWRNRIFQRLFYTGRAFETVFFGSREEADRVLRMVGHMHSRVHGELAYDAGPVKAGTSYSAYDPDQMLWTVAVAADSARYFYELFVRPLTTTEKDELWHDYVRFGELFGLDPAHCPRSDEEFQAWFTARLRSEQMHLTPESSYVGYAVLFQIPLPAAHAPAQLVHNAIQLGGLPPIVREHYGLRYGPGNELAFNAAVAAVRAARRIAPARLTRGSCAHSYELVAATEKARLAANRDVPEEGDVKRVALGA